MKINFIVRFLDMLLIKKNQNSRKPFGHKTPDSIKEFQENIDEIILEWKNYTESFSSSGEPIDEISKEQRYLNEDKKWKAIFLYVMGETNKHTEAYFSKTIQLAKKWEKDINLVFFSHLETGKHIPPHKGNNQYVLRCQIGIDICQPEKTGLRVNDKVVKLKEKELFIFDDTFEHEAWNYGETHRTVLIIDVQKKFSYFYNLINKYLLIRMKDTKYVQSVIKKLNN